MAIFPTDLMMLLFDTFVFLSVFLLIATLFRTPIAKADDSSFRIEVDNVNRHTIFEVMPLRPILFPIYQFIQRLNLPGLKRHIMAQLLALGNPNQYSAEEY